MTVDIAELKRLEAERTQNEWHLAVPSNGDPNGYSNIECNSIDIAYDVNDENAAFIAFMANNAKAIIEELGAGRDMCEIIMRDHQKLHAENARLRATLEWYAQKGIVCTLEVLHSPYVIADNGKRAREALGG